MLVILILVVVAAIVISLFVDRALKIGIETAGTKALGVGVNVGDVDLSILGGRLGFENLVIDNPPGYKHEKLLELGEARIAVDTGSLFTNTVNIKDNKARRGKCCSRIKEVFPAITFRI